MLVKYLLSIYLFFFISVFNTCYGDNNHSKAKDAMTAYDNGDYENAVTLLEDIAAEGVENAYIYSNLSNAYARLDKRGQAIAAALAALKLKPRDPDIKANLAFLEAKNKDLLRHKKEGGIEAYLLFWKNSVSLQELLNTFLILFFCAFLLLAISLWLPSIAPLKKAGQICLFLALTVFLTLMLSLNHNETWGAVSSEKSAVRSGPGEHNTLVFELHEGAPFILEEIDKDWLRILLSDGKKGWIPKQDCSVYGL